MVTFLFAYADWGVLLLRVVFGVVFVAHGWRKLKNLKQTQAWFQSEGFRPGIFWGTLIMLVENVGGLLMIVGLVTQVAAVLLAINMAVATAFNLKKGRPFIGGYELDLLLLSAAVAFALNGPAGLSLDNYLKFILF